MPGAAGSSTSSFARLRTVDSEIEELLMRHDPGIRETALRLRAMVLEVMPAAVEQVDPPDGLIAYGTGKRLGEQVFAIVPHGAHVNLQFADGVDLPDPARLLEGTGKRVRHVKNRSAADSERPALRQLVEAAVSRRGSSAADEPIDRCMPR